MALPSADAVVILQALPSHWEGALDRPHDSVRTPRQETDLRRGKPQRLFYLFTENLPQPSERSPSTQRPPLIPTSLRPAALLRPVCPAQGEERGVETDWRGVGGGLQSDQESQRAWSHAGSQPITSLPSVHYRYCCGASLGTPPAPTRSGSPKLAPPRPGAGRVPASQRSGRTV